MSTEYAAAADRPSDRVTTLPNYRASLSTLAQRLITYTERAALSRSVEKRVKFAALRDAVRAEIEHRDRIVRGEDAQ